MTNVKYLMMGLSALAVVLCLTAGVLGASGGQGIILLVAAALPLALGAMSLVRKSAMPRWACVVSMLGFVLTAMKTRGGGSDLENIMMVGFVGAIVAIVLIVKPESSGGDAAPEAAPAPAAEPEPAPEAAPAEASHEDDDSHQSY